MRDSVNRGIQWDIYSVGMRNIWLGNFVTDHIQDTCKVHALFVNVGTFCAQIVNSICIKAIL